MDDIRRRWVDIADAGIPGLEDGSEPAPARIRLIRTDENRGEVILIDGDDVTIGKGEKADRVIEGNPSISRVHARIFRSGDKWFIEDLNSLNHTYVDEERIIEPYPLRDGLVIRIANEDFILRMSK